MELIQKPSSTFLERISEGARASLLSAAQACARLRCARASGRQGTPGEDSGETVTQALAKKGNTPPRSFGQFKGTELLVPHGVSASSVGTEVGRN